MLCFFPPVAALRPQGGGTICPPQCARSRNCVCDSGRKFGQLLLVSIIRDALLCTKVLHLPVWWRLLAAHRGSAGPRLWPCRVLVPGCRDRPTSASWPPAWWRHSALTAARLGCECSGECCVSVPKPTCRTDFRRA
eukprot:9474371-Pyramimonas_sp.AAC.1